MRIDRNQALQYYENTKNVSSAKSDNIAASSSLSKTDSISISSEASRKIEIAATVQNIATDVETSVSRAKLQQLSAQIEAGTYKVSTNQLADAILNDWH